MIRCLSVCSGIEAWSCAVEGMDGYSVSALSEIEPFPCAVLAERYPFVPNLGDMTKINGWAMRGQIDLLVGGTPCFAAGAMVLTPEGYRPIESLRAGDPVVSAQGNVRSIRAVGSKLAETGTVKVLGRPEIECTGNHPFLCFPVARQRGRVLPAGEPRYVPVSEAVGMYACRGLFLQQRVPEFPHVPGADERDIMELAGWYAGDGYVRRWTGKRKKAVVLALVDAGKLAKFVFRFPFLHVCIGRDGKAAVYCTALADWLSENFGELSHGKRIPYWLYGHPQKDAFLAGYEATDGCVGRGRHRATTTSRALAFGLADLYGGGCVRLDKRPEMAVIEGRTVHQRDTLEIVRSLGDPVRTRLHFGRWSSIVRSWNPSEKMQTVYNIEVEDDHDYIVNGLAVHNCQGFSVAGLRGGLNDPRSGLAGHYVRLAAELRVPWLLWENVPGALSTSAGGDFRAFVSALDELGYGLAWAVLDAQWFGVPQRRQRLFLVGRLGDWRGPGAVLFEPGRVCRNPPARRSKREGNPSPAEGGAREGGSKESVAVFAQNQREEVRMLDIPGALAAEPGMHQQSYVVQNVCPTMTSSGAGFARVDGRAEHDCGTLVMQPNEVSATLCASGAGMSRPSAQGSQEGFCVVDGPLPRRLTPVECERLMGFPDGWTDVRFQGKPARDTLRYRALGNSMAVPVMRWLAEGIREFF